MKLTLPDRDLQLWIVFNVILSVIAIIIFTVILPNYGRIMEALTPRPERFTELYFEDHLDLPAKVMPEVPYEVTFSVNNLEGELTHYWVEADAVSVSTNSAQMTIPLFKADFQLLNEELQTIPFQFTLPLDFPIGKAKITIRLPEQDQSIHFYTSTESFPGITASEAAALAASPTPSPSPSATPLQIFLDQ